MQSIILLLFFLFVVFYLAAISMLLSVAKKSFPTDQKMLLARRVFLIGSLILLVVLSLFVISTKPNLDLVNIKLV